MTGDSPADLQRQLADLDGRMRRIEQALIRRGVMDAPDESHITRIERPVATPHPRAAIARLPSQTKDRQPSASRPHESVESRIGSHIFNRIGILALLIGAAWFLKFAFDNHWIGPTGRVAIGLIAGTAIIAWSERFRRQGYATFSYSLKAIGSGVLYLALWAAYDIYHLLPSSVAFVAMILVTSWNAYICWAQDSELLAGYAIAGGFITPVLVSTGENHEAVLCVYMLVLDAALCFLVSRRPWSRLVLAAVALTGVLFNAWATRFYNDNQFVLTTVFVSSFIVLFMVASWYFKENERDPASNTIDWDRLTIVFVPLATAIVGFAAFYAMLDREGRRWAQPWTAVLFGAFYLVLLRMMRDRATGRATQWKLRTLSGLHLAITVGLLTVAIPLKADGYWIAAGWLTEGAALLWIARRTEMLLLRSLAVTALALGLIGLHVIEPSEQLHVIFNQRFGAFLLGIASFAVVAWLAVRAAPTENGSALESQSQLAQALKWIHIAAAAVVVMNVLILVSVSLEIETYWRTHTFSSVYKLFGYSMWWMLFGATLLGIGFRKRSAFLRWQGLVVIAISIGKVFLIDTESLNQGYRILSFLVLGVLLLGVSYAYQRDWLVLRNPETQDRLPDQSPTSTTTT
jgi:uncharacterized membrane protein